MAKKSKRRSHNRVPATPTAVSSTGNSSASVASERTVVPRTVDVMTDYRYVISDLKRIGILAAAMFALLVALALLAQYVF